MFIGVCINGLFKARDYIHPFIVFSKGALFEENGVDKPLLLKEFICSMAKTLNVSLINIVAAEDKLFS